MKKTAKFILRKLFWGVFRHFLSDKWYMKIRYWLELNEFPNLESPEKFTEKIQYIKLFEHTEIRKKAADRTETRSYVKQKVGSEYLVPLLGIFEELTPNIWESLPQQFVLKANHGSGMIKIVFNKNEEDYADIYKQTEKWRTFNYARFSREWAYEGLPRTIVAEQLLLDSNQTIPADYKFFCFHGRAEILQVDFDRFNSQKRKLLDRNFNEIDAKILYPPYTGEIHKPPTLDKAIKIAEILASDVTFLRVDLYLLNSSIYVGELTNYPGNGFQPFEPENMEYKIGALLNL